MSAHSSNQSKIQPDFAFPATVSADADKDLKKAVDRHDAQAAINALIRLYIAKAQIDQDSIPSVIKTTEQISDTFAKDNLHGIFLSLLSQMYYSFYDNERWKYYFRDIPLTPLPDNITEWSAAQFESKICGLALESISGENARALSKCDITNYDNIITCSSEAAVYVPTLLDFAYCNAVRLSIDCSEDDFRKEVLRMALDNSKIGSAPYIYWSCEKAGFIYGKSHIDFLMNLLKEMSDNRYAGYIFTELSSSYPYDSAPAVEDELYYAEEESSTQVTDSETQYRHEVFDLANDYLNLFPETPFRQDILDLIGQVTRPYVTCNSHSLCAVGTPFEIKISNKNSPSLTLNIYKEKDGDNTFRIKKSELEGREKPIATYIINFDGIAPFKIDTVVNLSLSDPGYYKIIPVIPGEDKTKDPYITTTLRCVSLYPVTMSQVNKPAVAVVDPVSGAPIQGVDVTLIQNGKADIKAGKTDSDGLISVPDINSERFLSLFYNGIKQDFPSVSVDGINTHVDTSAIYHASVITDRSIYHPGEKLQLLAVVSESHNKLASRAQQNVCTNRRINIILLDANSQKVASIEGVTDNFGRAKAEFDLPTAGLTGNFTIQVSFPEVGKKSSRRARIIGTHHVMVSDFKLPDFEITDAVATNDTPSKGDVTITANLTTFSGIPVANTKATIIITGRSWAWWRDTSPRIFYRETVSGDDGKLSVVIPASVFAENKKYSFFNASIEAESATGTKSSTNFVFSTGKKYYISLFCNDVIDGNAPFSPTIMVNAADGSTVDMPLKWKLTEKSGKVIADGEYNGEISLKDVIPGTYNFIVSTDDTDVAEPLKTTIEIYNVNSDVVPGNDRIWLPMSEYTVDDGKCDILYGTPFSDTWVYCTISDGAGQLSDIFVTRHDKGYHRIPVSIPDGMQRVYVNIFSVNNLIICKKQIIVERKRQNRSLKIVGESFRDRLVPGSEETWKIRISESDGRTGQSALILDMYNKALESISDHDPAVVAYGSSVFCPLNLDYIPYLYRSFNVSSPNVSKAKSFLLPKFNFYGKTLSGWIRYDAPEDYVVYGYGTMRKSAVLTNSGAIPEAATFASADMMENEDMDVEESEEDGDTGETNPSSDSQQNDNFEYRSDYVPLAVWAPMLTTDEDGNVCYSFTLPNANTTWRLIALAWTQDFKLGKLVRDFVAAKPIMVQPNLPRFLRQGDSAVILASVMNNSEDTVTATTVIELFNPVTGAVLDRKEFRQEIAPGISATVSSDITADKDLEAIGYSIRTSNGDFSDGEQSVIRILPSEAALIETTPFYLNPGETEFSTKLPDDKDARISLTFMENPSWTILTALPGLRTQIDNYANSAAAALYSAGIARGLTKDNPRLADAIRHWSDNPSDSTLVSMLEKNEDLKIALLNATPWVQAAQSDTERMASLAMLLDNKQVEASISKALDILTDLQQKDGGWKWSKWCNESSVWVTSNVLAMMADLKSLGWLPADKEISSMLKKAIGYYDSKVRETDILYAILRPQFGDIPVSSNGKSVIDRTIREISTDWKKYDDVAYKAMAAEALYRNKEQILAAELMRSISEFGVMTKDQGLRFPSVNALYNYAILLDAYALIKPGSKEVDGLRQQLIVRKQGADWGAAVVTTEVVQSILSSGSNWMVDAHGTEITVGNHKIEPTSPVEQITGWLRADLSSYAGKKLNIETSGTGPSYGAVYAQFGRKMTDVKAVGCDDLDIEKTLFVRRGTGWENVETLRVGDRVKVQLTIHCKRNLSYVSIIDERPACYEPVDQLPGWMWSEGVGFYRENRDSRTQLHVEYMAPGTYLLTYEMNVNNAGVFSSGVASIQSQYAPEISAHSSGTTVKVDAK